MTDRINWIDWAKVVAIAFVVYGHTPQEKGSFLVGFVCTFHMPFFFLLSGYLSKGSTDIRQNIKKHLHTLIIPYFLYNIIFYPYWVVRYFVDANGHFMWFDGVVKPFVGLFFLQIESPISTNLNGATWFLAALLVMRVLLNLSYRCHHTNNTLVLMALMMIPVNVYFEYHQSVHSLFIAGLFRCFPFYVLGHLMRKEVWENRCIIVNHTWTMIVSLALSVLLYLYGDVLANDRLAAIWLTYVTTIMACFAVIHSCKLLDDYSSDFLVLLSNGTLMIMGLHWMYIGTINFLLEKMMGISDITYSWYVAILLSLAICLLIYPLIVLSMRHFPALLGKRK